MANHLISNRMMFGNMILVNSPVWVERYNRALKSLSGRQTQLTEFHVDISGFSPEVADEFGNDDYLKPKHGHRQFIILTTQQASSPMLTGSFSFLREGLKDFIQINEAAISTITAYDVLVGDIDDSSWRIKSPDDLRKLRSVRYSAGSLSGGCTDSAKMKVMADAFMSEEDAWMDDELISKMVQLSKKGGDFVKNPVKIDDLTLRIQTYYTKLFGGVYVINSPKISMMAFRQPQQRPELGVKGYVAFDVKSRNLMSTLSQAGLTESLIQGRMDVLPALQRKKEYAMIACICDQKEGVISGLDARSLRLTMGREDIQSSDVVIRLTEICKDVETEYPMDEISTHDVIWPYVHRASHGPEESVVNAILAENTPDDPAPLFALNKDAFFRTYAGWNEDRKRCFTQRIAEDYMTKKVQFRIETFGHKTLLRNPVEAAAGDGEPEAPLVLA